MVQRMKNKENLELLAEKIRQVDAVVIGGVPGFPVQQAIITTIGCLIWKDSCRILLLLFFTRATVGILRTLYTKSVGCPNGADLLCLGGDCKGKRSIYINNQCGYAV